MRQLTFLLLMSLGANAQTVINVHNGDNLQALIDANPAGSVYYLHAGSYGNLTLNKQVTIFGGGFFLTPNNAVSPSHAVIGNVTFEPGSERSMVAGLQCNTVRIRDNYIVVQKCQTGDIFIADTGRADNVTVKQNYGGCHLYIQNGTGYVVRNNIICGFLRQNFSSSNRCGDCFGIIENNTFDFDIAGDSYSWDARNTVRNNIFGGGFSTRFDASNQVYLEYNVWGNKYLNDILNYSSTNRRVDRNALFAGYPNNTSKLLTDARFQLAPNSPARGAGENGTDCGAFGGDDPYVLSGIPDIPSIYQLSVPSQVPENGTLNVLIKAKTNN